MAATPWKIEWSDTLSMGDAGIDKDHKAFIALVNELNSAIIRRHSKADVETILKRIVDHSVQHFANEEKLFVQMRYPKTQEHMEQHAKLIITLKKIMAKIHNTDFGREWTEMGLSIKHALIDHILIDDTQYIGHLHKAK